MLPKRKVNLAPANVKEVKQAKQVIKKTVNEENLNSWNLKVQQLVVQGKFTKLVALEEKDLTWKSYIHNVPKGIMSFALKSSVNGLNTPTNLKKMG